MCTECERDIPVGPTKRTRLELARTRGTTFDRGAVLALPWCLVLVQGIANQRLHVTKLVPICTTVFDPRAVEC